MKNWAKWLGVLLLFIMAFYVVGVDRAGALIVKTDTNTVGAYHGDGTTMVNPNTGKVLDSSGTVYNEVDDFWMMFSTNIPDSQTNKTAVNVRVSSANVLQVSVQNATSITTGTITGIDGVNYNLASDFWARLSSNTNDSAINKTALNVRPSTAIAIPIITGPGIPISVNIAGASNTVIINPAQPVWVNIDPTSNTVRDVSADDYFFASISTTIYPNQSRTLTLNAVGIGFRLEIQGGTIAYTTSWGGLSDAHGASIISREFSIPTTTTPYITSALNGNVTAYITLDGKRKK